MKTDFQKIKDELERLYKEAVSATNPMFLERAPRYFEFITKTPCLGAIMLEDEKHREDRIRDKTDKGLDFLFWLLYRDMPVMIDKLNKKEGFEAPLLRRTRFQKILKWLGLEKSESNKLVPRYKGILKLFHNQLLDRIAEQEFGHTEIWVPSEAVKKLGLTSKSRWEELQINFIDEFQVRIKYGENDYIASHEDLGFDDKRKKSQAKTKDSWHLLQTLSLRKGAIILPKIKTEDKEKLKKQKQELTKILKNYFGIIGDPFIKLDPRTKEYRIKIKLLPDPEFRPKKRDFGIYEEMDEKPKELLRSIDKL